MWQALACHVSGSWNFQDHIPKQELGNEQKRDDQQEVKNYVAAMNQAIEELNINLKPFTRFWMEMAEWGDL